MPIYIIEHLEPRLWKWSGLEYRHISELVGKRNLLFTNVRSSAVAAKLRRLGRVEKRSVVALNLDRVCILDPETPRTLTPGGARKCAAFVFGGILGDYPPQARTKALLTRKLQHALRNAIVRNLGKKQMATDNAVAVVREIVRGKRLSQLRFVDEPSITMRPGESVALPYRYLADKRGLPFISPALLRHLASGKTF